MNSSVKNILGSSDYCTIATTSSNGVPWNVPVRFAFDENFLYFRSPVGTTHGENIAGSGRVSVVVVDTTQTVKGAVYIHSSAEKLDGENEMMAIQEFNRRFDNPPQQWEQTEYYRIPVGELDTVQSRGEMYYFQEQAS